MSSAFRNALEAVINISSKENGSNTPDFILAEYLQDCLDAFDRAVNARSKWYGRHDEPGRTITFPAEPETGTGAKDE